ncbi:disulfide bond formation protein B [Candidatus Uhrbacteria bacterium]|nr:disulfide bond formation protein B [Candidatus Uhrbacteria bacterium]
MDGAAQTTTKILSSLTVAGDILIVAFLVVFIILYFKQDANYFKDGREALRFLGKNAVLFSFLIALASVAGSLYYSEIVGFAPCKLCWIQRIFIYPQVIILGMALRKEDSGVANYSIALSGIGAIFSAYHQYLQFGGHSLFSCSANAVSCSQRLTLEFGYVTIPMMMLTAFLLIILLMAAHKKSFRDEKQ